MTVVADIHTSLYLYPLIEPLTGDAGLGHMTFFGQWNNNTFGGALPPTSFSL